MGDTYLAHFWVFPPRLAGKGLKVDSSKTQHYDDEIRKRTWSSVTRKAREVMGVITL
jgi:hypothetical protein